MIIGYCDYQLLTKTAKYRYFFGDRFPIQWQELDLVRRFERDGDKEGFPCRLACVADSRSEVEMDHLMTT